MIAARSNLNAVHAIDAAWNARDWTGYAAHFADDLVADGAGGALRDKAGHVADARAFCARFPDARVGEPYLDIFASHDGTRSVSVARLTGTDPATGRGFDAPFCVISTWRGGRVARQRQFVDTETLRRQLGASSEGNTP